MPKIAGDKTPCCNHCGERLSEAVRIACWAHEGSRLARRQAHMDALRSRNVTYTHEGAFLDDGTPLTDEIVESWGWRKDGDSWVWP